MIIWITDQIKISKYSPDKKGLPKTQDPTTVVPAKKRDLPLEGGHYTKISGMWTPKHEIISPKFCGLLIKTELKCESSMDLNNFYNHINFCINAVTRIQEDLLPGYQFMERHSEFAEYFIPDRDHPSYSWNVQVYTSLGHSLLVAMTNYTCVKFCMAPQAYKIFSTHAHEISGWNILSIILHSCAPQLGGMHGDVKSDLATLAFKNWEQPEDFHIRILKIQQ